MGTNYFVQSVWRHRLLSLNVGETERRNSRFHTEDHKGTKNPSKTEKLFSSISMTGKPLDYVYSKRWTFETRLFTALCCLGYVTPHSFFRRIFKVGSFNFFSFQNKVFLLPSSKIENKNHASLLNQGACGDRNEWVTRSFKIKCYDQFFNNDYENKPTRWFAYEMF